MSIENVKTFFKKVQEDTGLQEQLANVSKVRRDGGDAEKENHYQEVINIASGAGFEFTAEELDQAKQEIAGELSDKDLQKVSGGQDGDAGSHCPSEYIPWCKTIFTLYMDP